MTRGRWSGPTSMRRPAAPTHRRAVLSALLATSVLVGCAGGDAGDDAAPPTLEAPGGADDGAPDLEDGADTDGAIAPGLQDAVTVAVADAAGVAGVSEDAIAVLVAETVTWPDGSLGCPEPGMTYTQALVDGYRIDLEVGGARVTYHGALGSPPFRCRDPEPPVS